MYVLIHYNGNYGRISYKLFTYCTGLREISQHINDNFNKYLFDKMVIPKEFNTCKKLVHYDHLVDKKINCFSDKVLISLFKMKNIKLLHKTITDKLIIPKDTERYCVEYNKDEKKIIKKNISIVISESSISGIYTTQRKLFNSIKVNYSDIMVITK